MQTLIKLCRSSKTSMAIRSFSDFAKGLLTYPRHRAFTRLVPQFSGIAANRAPPMAYIVADPGTDMSTEAIPVRLRVSPEGITLPRLRLGCIRHFPFLH